MPVLCVCNNKDDVIGPKEKQPTSCLLLVLLVFPIRLFLSSLVSSRSFVVRFVTLKFYSTAPNLICYCCCCSLSRWWCCCLVEDASFLPWGCYRWWWWCCCCCCYLLRLIVPVGWFVACVRCSLSVAGWLLVVRNLVGVRLAAFLRSFKPKKAFHDYFRSDLLPTSHSFTVFLLNSWLNFPIESQERLQINHRIGLGTL